MLVRFTAQTTSLRLMRKVPAAFQPRQRNAFRVPNGATRIDKRTLSARQQTEQTQSLVQTRANTHTGICFWMTPNHRLYHGYSFAR